MVWLRRHSWWLLMSMAALLVMFGVTDMLIGAEADPGIPLGLIGLAPAELKAQTEVGYRIFDFFTRTQGLALLVFGALAAAILWFGYRRDQRWAWWAMWVLPLWSAAVLAFYLAAGTEPGQAPPPPMVSGPILAVLAAAVQLVNAPRFFRPES